MYSRVGHRSSDVGSHNHVDGILNRNGPRSHERDNDGGCGGGRLEHNGNKHTDHKTGDGVGLFAKQGSGGAPGQHLGGTSKQFNRDQEEIKEEHGSANSDEDFTPLISVMNATGVEDLSPGGIHDVLGFLFVEISIAVVGRAGGTILVGGEDVGVRGGCRLGDAVEQFGRLGDAVDQFGFGRHGVGRHGVDDVLMPQK